MLQSILALALAFSLNSAFAQSGEIPPGTLLVLQGVDASGEQACRLYVTAVQSTSPWQAQVLTSYSHGQDAPSLITVRAANGRPGVLMGVGANGQDQIAIFLNSAGSDLQTAQAFNLKWLHGDHFHTNRCQNLQPVQP